MRASGGGMQREEIRARIVAIGIVPVIRAASAALAVRAAEAVRAGGVTVVEVTMTVPGAFEAIESLARRYGEEELLIGAGTVLDAATARRCLAAGARFLVSPGFDAAVTALAGPSGAVVMPGALTPTEVIAAWRAGADFVKIFPCGQVGGPSYLKALKAPLPQVEMIPTGGVSLETVPAYLRAGAAALGVGSELISAAALARNDTASITESARQFLAAVRRAREPEAAAGMR